MKQDDINEAQWRDPRNWTWRGPLGLYSSKADSRWLVPKATPGMGWTFNFAHPACAYALIGLAIAPLLFSLLKHLWM